MLVCSCGKFVFLEGAAKSVTCPQCGETVAAGAMGNVKISAKRRAKVTVRPGGDVFLGGSPADSMPRAAPIRGWWIPVGIALLAAAVPSIGEFARSRGAMGPDVWKGGLLVASGLLAVFFAVLDVRPVRRAWTGIALTVAILGLHHRSAPIEASYLVTAALPAALALVMASHMSRRHFPDSRPAAWLGRAAGAAFLMGVAIEILMLPEPIRWAADRWPVATIAAVYSFVAVLAILGRGADAGWWTGFAAAVVILGLAAMGDFAGFVEIWAPPALLCVSGADAVSPRITPGASLPEYSDTRPAESA